MEDHRSTRRLKRAELAGASSPTASKRRRRLAFVREESFELQSEEREGEPQCLLLPCSDSSEKIDVPSEESGEVVVVSSNLASSSSSSCIPFDPPRFPGRCDEESVDGAKEKLHVVVYRQRQAKSFETEASTCNGDFSREATPSSEAASAESRTMKPSGERKPPAADVPSREELESFFSAAEKREQQRFAEKYNYDVAMDVPLEGRYRWIRSKP
ncbi:hypothetical protein ACJRO7_020245 [Eucalyptus globulus]|uniref:Cyclin-dependent kinase inhibitor n=1 Tax=Eucalyptus globulus TaxID=34317 RepID=A0ABD3KSP0_EUCGL